MRNNAWIALAIVGVLLAFVVGTGSSQSNNDEPFTFLPGVVAVEQNTRMRLSTNESTATNNSLIDLDFNADEAKATIAYRDKTGAPKIWLAGHDYLSFPTNRHQHFSIETTDASGQLQSRLEIPYDSDTVDIETHDSNFVVGGTGNFEVAGGNSTFNGNINTVEGNIAIDNTGTASFRIDRGSTSNFGSIILTTAGVDRWSMQMRNDGTNNFHFRDNINGNTPIRIAPGSTTTTTFTGSIIMQGLPTSDPGVACQLWNNAGAINISLPCP